MIGIGFLICVFGIGIINLLLPSKKISEEENRGLQQKPELSVSAVTSGSYMDQYEKYQADQFMGRNMWRSLKVGFSRLAGSKEENGVFIGKKGHSASPGSTLFLYSSMPAFWAAVCTAGSSFTAVSSARCILSVEFPLRKAPLIGELRSRAASADGNGERFSFRPLRA